MKHVYVMEDDEGYAVGAAVLPATSVGAPMIDKTITAPTAIFLAELDRRKAELALVRRQARRMGYATN